MTSIGDWAGSTDTISTLPMIACCMIAAMTLVAALGTSITGDEDNASDQLSRICRESLDEVIGKIAMPSLDHLLYLLPDWQNRTSQLNFSSLIENGVSISIIVKIVRAKDCVLYISGDMESCEMRRFQSEPGLLAVGEKRIPAEIGVMVGES